MYILAFCEWHLLNSYKNVKKKNSSLPIKGEPNSSTSNYNENGKLLRGDFMMKMERSV